MTLYVTTPSGQPAPALAVRSVKAGASPYARCPKCLSTAPLVRREGEGSLLPLAHTRGCPIWDAELLQLMADREGAAEQGDGLVVASRFPTPCELGLLEALSHDVDPSSRVTVTVDGELRRRCFVRTDGADVAW